MALGSDGPVRRSFHDPEGAVFEDGGRLLRRVTPRAGTRILEFLASPLGRELQAERAIPATHRTEPAGGEPDAVWLRHERVRFPGYPHEWVPEMLADAGLFTVRLARRLLEQGWVLKDAAARNILFEETRPVFVDVCSLVRWDGSPVWIARGQFERHFVLPLLAFRHLRQPPHAAHLAQPDGVSHESLYESVGGRSWLMPSLFLSCALPARLARGAGAAREYVSSGSDPQTSGPVLRWSLDRAERHLGSLRNRLPSARSAWAGYWDAREHYSDEDRLRKAQRVKDFLIQAQPATVLDVGSNTGEYSRLAASLGASVVAVESDLAAQRLAYEASRESAASVLHLLVDFANPTPPLGWNGRECLGFDERARGAFDCVMALAVVHHLLASRGIPLAEIVDKLADCTVRHAIIEYVAPEDPKFRLLASQRHLDFSWLTSAAFCVELERRFRIVRKEALVAGQRQLLLCEKV